MVSVPKLERQIRSEFLGFGTPLIEEPEIAEVLATLRSGWLVTGPRVAKFEQMFREFTGAEHAIAVSSCTAALHLSMVASGIGPGDEVISTPMTFCATVNTIIHSGATPVLVDCERDSFLMDPKLIEAAITPRTKAILPVHLCGRPCEMDAIMAIARKHKLIVIEDAAHAIEAKYRGQKVGNIGHVGTFSFYATKNVSTGEGGMVTTNNSDLAEKIRTYALHGMSKGAWKRYSKEGYKHYRVVFPGFKYNMMDLQAALGIHQLARAPKNLERRNQIVRRYNEAFRGLPLGLPLPAGNDMLHSWHLYPVLVDKQLCGIDRDEFMLRLHGSNIGTGVHYVGVHLHPYYRDTYGYKPKDFPNASWISDRTASIPLSPKLTDEDVEDVIEAVRHALR